MMGQGCYKQFCQLSFLHMAAVVVLLPAQIMPDSAFFYFSNIIVCSLFVSLCCWETCPVDTESVTLLQWVISEDKEGFILCASSNCFLKESYSSHLFVNMNTANCLKIGD